jgi:adenylate cyclase
MAEQPTQSPYWREFLLGTTVSQASLAFMHRLPHAPRCKICQAPFAGWGGRMVSLVGYRPIPGNPRICTYCLRTVSSHPGGAEIEVSILFADIRGSTAIAEEVGATAFGGLLNRFYAAATDAIDEARGIVDKYVGDGIIGLFFQGVSGDEHAAKAIEAGRALIRATLAGPEPMPVGAGVHTGEAFVGVVGSEGGPLDFTAVGDVVNTAARLGSLAAEGELLVSTTAAAAANLDSAGMQRRWLEVRGRSQPVEVLVIPGARVS